jgi:hypothetical protein
LVGTDLTDTDIKPESRSLSIFFLSFFFIPSKRKRGKKLDKLENKKAQTSDPDGKG